MEIWAVDRKDSYYSQNPLLFVREITEIKRCILLCAHKGFYPEPQFNPVRVKLLSYHLYESFKIRKVPMPGFADGNRLNEDGCLKFYKKMNDMKDPIIEKWDLIQREESNTMEIKQYLGLE